MSVSLEHWALLVPPPESAVPAGTKWPTLKLVLAVMASFTHHTTGDVCFASDARIAERAGVSQSVAKRSRLALEELGYITATRRANGRTVRYVFNRETKVTDDLVPADGELVCRDCRQERAGSDDPALFDDGGRQ